MNNDIQESYCSFEVSKLLKSKGFNVLPENTLPTDYIIGYQWDEDDEDDTLKVQEFQWEDSIQSNRYLRPTHALAIEWIRVNFGIWILIDIDDVKHSLCNYVVKWHNKKCLNESRGKGYVTPQEATEAALLYTLKELIP